MRNKVVFILIGLFILYIYRIIFSIVPIYGGDYIHLDHKSFEYLLKYSFQVWESHYNLGWNRIALMWSAPYSTIIGLIGRFPILSNQLAERIIIWIPFLILSGFSVQRLTRYILKDSIYSPLSILIYLTNTYILMIIAGGQIVGIGFAYAILPLILYGSITQIDQLFERTTTFARALLMGILFDLILIFDLRIAYIAILATGIYWLFACIQIKKDIRILSSFFYAFVIPAIVVLVCNLYWIIPFFIFRTSPLEQGGVGYTTIVALKYFSFATFENAISLLHPNWPENIFGKVYFMRPEFLLIPITAFGGLWFKNRLKVKKSVLNDSPTDQMLKMQFRNEKFENREQARNDRIIVFFALLGLLGAFLAKGANEPFGGIYQFLFTYAPGFSLFRDSTKWYMLIAVSYSILIPYTVHQVFFRTRIHYYILVLWCLLWMFIIRDGVVKTLKGTFTMHPVAQEYTQFNASILRDTTFYRTLWVPTISRYNELSYIHPAISASDLLRMPDISSQAAFLTSQRGQLFLKESLVKYIVVPTDPDSEIFLKDRKYDDKKRSLLIARLKTVFPLNKDYTNIIVFSISQNRDRFWVNDSKQAISYVYLSPSHFKINQNNNLLSQKIIFSESYDSNWYITDGNSKIFSKPYYVDEHISLNSFVLPKRLNGSVLSVQYLPQDYVAIFLLISTVCALGVLSYVCIKRKKL